MLCKVDLRQGDIPPEKYAKAMEPLAMQLQIAYDMQGQELDYQYDVRYFALVAFVYLCDVLSEWLQNIEYSSVCLR